MYFLVCLLILVIIIKISNVKESFTGVCVPIFDPYINTRLRKTDIETLYEEKKNKSGQFKGFIEGRIKYDKTDYNAKVGYFQDFNNIYIERINDDAHSKDCNDVLDII